MPPPAGHPTCRLRAAPHTLLTHGLSQQRVARETGINLPASGSASGSDRSRLIMTNPCGAAHLLLHPPEVQHLEVLAAVHHVQSVRGSRQGRARPGACQQGLATRENASSSSSRGRHAELACRPFSHHAGVCAPSPVVLHLGNLILQQAQVLQLWQRGQRVKVLRSATHRRLRIHGCMQDRIGGPGLAEVHARGVKARQQHTCKFLSLLFVKMSCVRLGTDSAGGSACT